MRFIYSILCITVIAALFAWNAQASDLVGGKAKIVSTLVLNGSATDYLKNICENEAGYLTTVPTKSDCRRIVAQIKISQETYDYCKSNAETSSSSYHNFMSCIQQHDGMDYPYSYTASCRNVKKLSKDNVSPLFSSPKVCMQYLARTSSKFDSEAFELCLTINDQNFQDAKGCLNNIRDRQIDVQKIERECLTGSRPNQKTRECLENLTDAMPSANNCATPPRPGSRSATSGTR